MGSDLYVALSGALARLHEIEVVSNNLANADTVGFKRDRTSFTAALETALRTPDQKITPGATAKVFTGVGEERFDPSPGPTEQTGAPLDVAIEGEGFFEVETPEGPRYTRAGSFIVDAQGRLATPAGHPVMGSGGPISIDDGAAAILSSGEIAAPADNPEDPQRILGRLKIVDFEDHAALSKTGGNLFQAADGVEPQILDDAAVLERSIERSNVRPVQELADLIIVQRSFDVAMQMLQADDETSQSLIREVSS